MPHRHPMSPDEREAYVAELRARREAGTLAEVLVPDSQAVERLLSDVKKRHAHDDSPPTRPSIRRSRR